MPWCHTTFFFYSACIPRLLFPCSVVQWVRKSEKICQINKKKNDIKELCNKQNFCPCNTQTPLNFHFSNCKLLAHFYLCVFSGKKVCSCIILYLQYHIFQMNFYGINCALAFALCFSSLSSVRPFPYTLVRALFFSTHL